MMRGLSKIGRHTIFYIKCTVFDSKSYCPVHLSLFRTSEGVSPYASR